jgi:hypothetical protein
MVNDVDDGSSAEEQRACPHGPRDPRGDGPADERPDRIASAATGGTRAIAEQHWNTEVESKVPDPFSAAPGRKLKLEGR